MNTADTIPAGSAVAAQPWRGGTELPARRGFVLTSPWNTGGEYVLVWFPTLGAPVVGRTVMPIRVDKIMAAGGPADAATVSTKFVGTAYNLMRRVNRAGGWRDEWTPGALVIERVHRANLATRREAERGVA